MAENEHFSTVSITQWPERAVSMEFSAREPVPVCISLCEPICAESDYTIEVDIFSLPVAAVTVRGMTRLFNCAEKPPVTT